MIIYVVGGGAWEGVLLMDLQGNGGTVVYSLPSHHRRRIELEDQAKVVLSVWGTESLLR